MANMAKWKNLVFNVGDTIRVYHKVKEGGKERLQFFEGVVIAIKNKAAGKSFTVRKISVNQIGVEKIWPLSCPSISDIKIVKKGKARRAKLYYLRKKAGREALRVKEAKKTAFDESKKNPEKLQEKIPVNP